MRRSAVFGRAVALTALLAMSAGCSGPTACPAILYGARLTVSLDETWPDRGELTLAVECVGDDASACDLVGDVAGPVWEGTLTYSTPQLRAIVGRGGETVATVTFEPDFVVVEYPNGRACGGPRSAEVSIPPPT